MYDDPNQMTPFLPGEDLDLSQLSWNIIQKSSALGGQLHSRSREKVIGLLRLMNSYYSNLIEGHHTHPIDIEKALHQNYSADSLKKAYQIESRVHVELQMSLEKEQQEKDLQVTSSPFLQSIHRRFYEHLPSSLRKVKSDQTGDEVDVLPGELRRHEVIVGEHIAPTYTYLPAFLEKFHKTYSPHHFSQEKKLIAAAASHHRLAWIHPFSDGNGRVARLFTDVYLRDISLQGYGLWNVSRGLARFQKEYRDALVWGDATRQGDLDGRGNLSLKGLKKFCQFFLKTCLDQIDFMDSLLQLDGLLERIQGYVELRKQKMLPEESPLKSESSYLLQEVLLKGKVPRGEAARITGLPERTARTIVSQLVKEGMLVSETPKGPLEIAFPTHIAYYWFPHLYPRMTKTI